MSITMGEALARRKLKHRVGANGTVFVYEPGQHKAQRIGPNDAILSYVDREGAVCILPVERRDGEWFQRGFVIRATQNFAESRNVRRTMALGDEQVRALQEAFEKKEAPAQSGQ